jgi:hypothetical protein
MKRTISDFRELEEVMPETDIVQPVLYLGGGRCGVDSGEANTSVVTVDDKLVGRYYFHELARIVQPRDGRLKSCDRVSLDDCIDFTPSCT